MLHLTSEFTSIENILRARFGNVLVHGADYTLSGHSDLEFEFVVDGVLVSFLRPAIFKRIYQFARLCVLALGTATLRLRLNSTSAPP
jgi:hypothetical protein